MLAVMLKAQIRSTQLISLHVSRLSLLLIISHMYPVFIKHRPGGITLLLKTFVSHTCNQNKGHNLNTEVQSIL